MRFHTHKLPSTLILMAVGVLLLSACQSASKPKGSLTDAEVKQLVEMKRQSDPFQRSQKDFGLSAKPAGGGKIAVTIVNRTQQSVKVSPEQFAVILPPSKDLQHPMPGSLKSFPSAEIAPGDQASGTLQFESIARSAEPRLVYKHPDFAPAMAPIE